MVGLSRQVLLGGLREVSLNGQYVAISRWPDAGEESGELYDIHAFGIIVDRWYPT